MKIEIKSNLSWNRIFWCHGSDAVSRDITLDKDNFKNKNFTSFILSTIKYANSTGDNVNNKNVMKNIDKFWKSGHKFAEVISVKFF